MGLEIILSPFISLLYISVLYTALQQVGNAENGTTVELRE